MKTIGLIGGMSWESSLEYYRLINQDVRGRLGGQHSAKSIMVSVDFSEIERLQYQNRWREAAAILADAAGSLERAGADFMLLCTNTMHKVAADIERAVRIPLVHIADATADRIVTAGISRVGLLATRFTMEEDFYKERLRKRANVDVIIPSDADRDSIHRIIYDELCLGKIRPESKQKYLQIIERLVSAGCQGVILGCTEIPLLVKDDDCSVPLFDTTRIHAEVAVDRALAGDVPDAEKTGSNRR